MRSGAIERNANIYPSYRSIFDYRKANCTPKGIVFGDDEVICSMQSTLNHQLSRLLEVDPDLEVTVSHYSDEGFQIEYLYKFGKIF